MPAAIEALKQLDPGQRALLDLSLNRELSDSLIAGLLENTDESGVAGMRREALAALARAAEIDGPGATGEVERQLRSASDLQWLGAGEGNGHHANGHVRGSAKGHANGNGHGVVATVPPPAKTSTTPRTQPREGDRSGRVWAAAFALLAIVGVISIAVALAGDDDSGTGTSAESGDAPAAAGPAGDGGSAPAEPVALEALAPGAAGGSATIAPAPEGEGYVLRLEGLPRPDGYYRLWAYDSLIESTPIAGLATGDGAVAFDLPANSGDFESLDLSVETGPGDSIHSGQSLFRLPLSAID